MTRVYLDDRLNIFMHINPIYLYHVNKSDLKKVILQIQDLV